MQVAPRANPIERRISKFLREPPSIRIAASVTSTFVARADQERATEEDLENAALEERLDARFDELKRRFDRLESRLGEVDG